LPKSRGHFFYKIHIRVSIQSWSVGRQIYLFSFYPQIFEGSVCRLFCTKCNCKYNAPGFTGDKFLSEIDKHKIVISYLKTPFVSTLIFSLCEEVSYIGSIKSSTMTFRIKTLFSLSVIGLATDLVRAGNTCAEVQCPPGYVCDMVKPRYCYWCPEQPQCVPSTSCEGVECPTGSECQVQSPPAYCTWCQPRVFCVAIQQS